MKTAKPGSSKMKPSSRSVEFSDYPLDLEIERPKLCCSGRLFIAMICFVALFNVTYLRVGFSMAEVCMVISDEKTETNHQGEFNWSPSTKGYIFSAIFYGFIAGPFLAGFLSFKIGGKIVLLIGTFGTSVTLFFTPEAARANVILLCAVRVATGFLGGFTFPAFYDLISKWVVPEERQLLVTGALVGIPAASILSFPTTSIICNFCGWVWLFYSMAIWIMVCGIVFGFVIYEDPARCPFISEKEVIFLKARILTAAKVKIPWKQIVKSLPIHAYVIIHFGLNYVYLTLIFSLPLLMKNVHHFPLQENGFLSATPFMGSFLMRILLSLFFEQLRIKLKLTKNTLRKTFVFLGATLVSSFLLVTTFLSCAYRYWVLGCFIMASSSLELCLTGGYLLSLLDLCPSYVNILTGLTNTVGSLAGLISPVVNGVIAKNGTREEWNKVFYMNISILMLTSTFYLVFGKNTLQHWGLATSPQQMPVPRASLVN